MREATMAAIAARQQPLPTLPRKGLHRRDFENMAENRMDDA
jgi:hypothetical protein